MKKSLLEPLAYTYMDRLHTPGIDFLHLTSFQVSSFFFTLIKLFSNSFLTKIHESKFFWDFACLTMPLFRSHCINSLYNNIILHLKSFLPQNFAGIVLLSISWCLCQEFQCLSDVCSLVCDLFFCLWRLLDLSFISSFVNFTEICLGRCVFSFVELDDL